MTIDAAILSTGEHGVGHSNFLRQAARQPGPLVASLFAGFAVGVAYRFLFDPAVEQDLINFVRSGLQGAGVALAVLAVQIGFASGAQYRLGSTLRRLPLPGELVVRAVVMAAVVIVVNLTMQFLLYWQPSHGELWVKSVFIRACVKLRGLFRYPRSEPDCMTRPVSEHDQPHIRSPLETAVPTSRLRRAGAQGTKPFYQSACRAMVTIGSSTRIRQN
jgi:hypothetical protein